MEKITLTTEQAIDKITENLNSLDGDAIAHLFELVMGGSAMGIDGGLEWEPIDPAEEAVDTVMEVLGYKKGERQIRTHTERENHG